MSSFNSPGILKVALPVPVPHLFDYLPPSGALQPKPGSRVIVPFGRRRLVGVVMALASKSDLANDRLARVADVPDEGAILLNDELRELLAWCSRYYKHPIGEVVAHAMPPALRKSKGSLPDDPVVFVVTAQGREKLDSLPANAKAQKALLLRLMEGPADREALSACGSSWRSALARLVELGAVSEEAAAVPCVRASKGPELTQEQSRALEEIDPALEHFHCHLLDGVTGSGKTEVYLRLIAETLGKGLQVVLLVPEIGLTPQLLQPRPQSPTLSWRMTPLVSRRYPSLTPPAL